MILLKKIKYIFTGKCDHKGSLRFITANTRSGKPWHECIVCGMLIKDGKVVK